MNFKRIQGLPGKSTDSCFLWGPRQTGKSTLLQQILPDARFVDLLLSETFEELQRRPSSLREKILNDPQRSERVVVIDEVQKIPALLDEAQWLTRIIQLHARTETEKMALFTKQKSESVAGITVELFCEERGKKRIVR